MAHGPRGGGAPKAEDPHFEPPKVLKEDYGTPARTHNNSGTSAPGPKRRLSGNAADLAACGEGGRNHALNAKAGMAWAEWSRAAGIEKSRVESGADGRLPAPMAYSRMVARRRFATHWPVGCAAEWRTRIRT